MRYRLRCDLAFTDEETARQAFLYLKEKLAQVQPFAVNEVAGEEGKSLQLEICRHDEGGSCEVLEDASRGS